VNSNKKGKTWELEVSHLLEETFEGKFNRVPRSGAMFGGQNVKNIEGQRDDVKEIMSGDIITPKKFPFSVEAKSYSSFSFSKLYKGEYKLLDDWIVQAEADSKLSKKEMLILMKFNYKGAFAVFRRDIVSSKLLHTSTFFSNYFIYRRKYIIMSIDQFLEHGHMLEDFAKMKSIRMETSIAKKK
jgi:hypothetical protein